MDTVYEIKPNNINGICRRINEDTTEDVPLSKIRNMSDPVYHQHVYRSLKDKAADNFNNSLWSTVCNMHVIDPEEDLVPADQADPDLGLKPSIRIHPGPSDKSIDGPNQTGNLIVDGAEFGIGRYASCRFVADTAEMRKGDAEMCVQIATDELLKTLARTISPYMTGKHSVHMYYLPFGLFPVQLVLDNKSWCFDLQLFCECALAVKY